MSTVTFRRLVDEDLPMLHRWLNEPGVVAWWEGDDATWPGVVRQYGSGSTDPVELWIAVADGRDVGWIQCYACADEPDECEPWRSCGVAVETAAGIDYLIGERADRGRGLGSSTIGAFVDTIVFGRHPGWMQACAAPHADNKASWRALEKAGFRYAGMVRGAHGAGRLMVIDRPEPAPWPVDDSPLR